MVKLKFVAKKWRLIRHDNKMLIFSDSDIEKCIEYAKKKSIYIIPEGWDEI